MVQEGDTIILLAGIYVLKPFFHPKHVFFLESYEIFTFQLLLTAICFLFSFFLCMYSGMLLAHLSLEISQVNELCRLLRLVFLKVSEY